MEKLVKNQYKIDYSLYLVTDRGIAKPKDIYWCIEESILGGVTLVQLREKNISTYEFLQIAEKVKLVTDKYNVPLIINDRLDIALAIDAAGVHVGQSDMPAHIARKIIGSKKILGVSTANIEEAIRAEKDGADYLGVGAIFPTTSKSDTRKVSLSSLKEIKSMVKIPIVGIGGINQDNASKVINTGVDGIAVISSILSFDDIKTASNNLYNILKNS